MFSKQDAYSSIERTFLRIRQIRKLEISKEQLNTPKRIKYITKTVKLKSYLKPYSDMTFAGSPFPAATMRSSSYL